MSNVRVTISISKDDLEWYRANYPNDSLSWLFSSLLEEFRKCHVITPRDYAAIGARELRKGLKE